MSAGPSGRSLDIQRVAALARLRLEEHERAQYEPQLRAVLAHIALLDELDTQGVEATCHAATVAAPLRDDHVVPGLPRAVALAAAPRSRDGAFVVPQFVEGT